LATDPAAVYETSLKTLPLLHRGKVRDVYAVDAGHLLIVTTDRLSAFDVVMPNPIPGKGRVLHQISEFWFDQTAGIVRNHRSPRRVDELISEPAELSMLEGRASIVRRLHALPIEAVVRGYLAGSGWKEYQESGSVCGVKLPAGLKRASKLPQPIFTPATKAEAGHHDENITFESKFFAPKGYFTAHLNYPTQPVSMEIAISHPVGKWQVDDLTVTWNAKK